MKAPRYVSGHYILLFDRVSYRDERGRWRRGEVEEVVWNKWEHKVFVTLKGQPTTSYPTVALLLVGRGK